MTHRNAYMTDELEAIYEQTVDFVAKEVTPHGEAWEEAGKVPREVLRQMGELGMFGLRVPEEHGGLGMGMLASATFSEALGASTFAGFDVTVLVHTDMAGPHLINSGNDAAAGRAGCRRCWPVRRSCRSACPSPTPAPTWPASAPPR